jgi:Mg2+ and Co2+ transporter CorA
MDTGQTKQVCDPNAALGRLPGIVWAFRIGRARSVELVVEQDFTTGVASHGGADWFWFHVDLGDRRTPKTLNRVLELLRCSAADVPVSAVDEFCRPLTTPELHFTRGALHGALLDQVIEADGDSGGEQALLHVLVGRRLVLSGRRRHLRGVEAMRMLAREGGLGEGPVSLIETMVRRDSSERSATVEGLSESLNRIEDRVLADCGDIDRNQIIRIRHTLVRQYRELDALRRLFERLGQEVREETARAGAMTAAQLEQRAWTEFSSLQQHLSSLADRTLSLLDRARLLQQEVSDQLTVQTNRQLYVLSLLTAALVPPTIVVGLLGMNTGGLPLTDTPFGFVTALALCALSSLAVLGVLAASGLIRRPTRRWWRGVRGPDNGRESGRTHGAESIRGHPTSLLAPMARRD